MVAFGILGMMLAAAYTTSVRSLRAQNSAIQQHQMTTMARAILDEYIVTYPSMASQGTYKGVWKWSVEEQAATVLETTQYDRFFQFVRVTATVANATSETEPVSLSTVVARRAPDQ